MFPNTGRTRTLRNTLYAAITNILLTLTKQVQSWVCVRKEGIFFFFLISKNYLLEQEWDQLAFLVIHPSDVLAFLLESPFPQEATQLVAYWTLKSQGFQGISLKDIGNPS